MRSLPGVWKAADVDRPDSVFAGNRRSRTRGTPSPSATTGFPASRRPPIFVTRCASCHGTNAGGGEFAPSILERVPLRTDDELVKLLHNGIPSVQKISPALHDLYAFIEMIAFEFLANLHIGINEHIYACIDHNDAKLVLC